MNKPLDQHVLLSRHYGNLSGADRAKKFLVGILVSLKEFTTTQL